MPDFLVITQNVDGLHQARGQHQRRRAPRQHPARQVLARRNDRRDVGRFEPARGAALRAMRRFPATRRRLVRGDAARRCARARRARGTRLRRAARRRHRRRGLSRGDAARVRAPPRRRDRRDQPESDAPLRSRRLRAPRPVRHRPAGARRCRLGRCSASLVAFAFRRPASSLRRLQSRRHFARQPPRHPPEHHHTQDERRPQHPALHVRRLAQLLGAAEGHRARPRGRRRRSPAGPLRCRIRGPSSQSAAHQLAAW